MEEEQASDKEKKLRAWRAARDGRTAKDLVDVSDVPEDPEAAAKAMAEAEAQLKLLHEEFFGAPGAPNAIDTSADGLSVTERVVQSSCSLTSGGARRTTYPRRCRYPI